MTSALDVVRRLHQHRRWVNGNLLDAAAGLSEEQLRRAFPIGQGSVWRTLAHLWAAEYVWLGAIEGDPAAQPPGDQPGLLTGNQEGEGAAKTLAELRERWEALETRWTTYLEELDEASLDDEVVRQSTMGMRLTTKRLDTLIHVATHAHYTSAQLVNMLRQLGVETLPATMHIAMAREET